MSTSFTPQNKDVERAFLPAAEAIQAAPPPIASRILMIAICAFLIALITWAFIGKLDIVVTAQGKTFSETESQLVQSERTGSIKAILVRNGDQVSKGDPLVELDATSPSVEFEQTAEELNVRALEHAYFQALLANSSPSDDLQLLDHTPPSEELAKTRQRVALDRAQFETALARYEDDKMRGEAVLEGNALSLTRLQAQHAARKARLARLAPLGEQGFVARNSIEDLEYEVDNLASQVALAEAKQFELQAELDGAIKALELFRSEQRASWRDGAEEARLAFATTQRQRQLIARAQEITVIRAPVDGQIQDRQVNTVGGVVSAGQTLMVVAPVEFDLHIQALIANKDIGFIDEGMPVSIKLDALPFTRYGVLDGQLASLSLDSTTVEGPGGSSSAVYAARVSMDQQTLVAEGRPVRITPGMTATVEVQTGERRLIDFVLSPVMRFKDEAARER